MIFTPAAEKFIVRMLEELEQNPPPPFDQLSIEQYRTNLKPFLEFAAEPSDIEEKIQFIPVNKDHQIKIRIYCPEINLTLPTMVYFHGGGFVANLHCDYGLCSQIAKQSGWQVIFVDYRLAPEAPYPAAIEDAYFACKYLYEHADEFHIDRNNFVITGYSSGGNLAAHTVIQARGSREFTIKQQILISAAFDLSNSLKSHEEYAQQDILLVPGLINYLYRHYIPDNIDPRSPKLSPYWESDLSGLPKTTLIVAEYDRLRSDTECFHKRLLAADVSVSKTVLKNKIHAFIPAYKAFNDGENPIEFIVATLQSIV